MRVPPPGLLKIDKDALLRDVAARLAERLPQGQSPDPTDPGWLLLEQAAWMVEVLSEQLDRYPFAVLRQLLHVLGGHLRPARPALGVVVAAVSREGTMRQQPDSPSPWRLFTPQRERREAVEFVPVEAAVPLWKGGLVDLFEIADGELWEAGKAREGATDALQAWRQAPRRSGAFDGERIRYVVMTNNVSELMGSMRGAIQRLEERRVGWLRLSVEALASERVALVADIDPAGAFARTAPGGVWTGGDLQGDWGSLDESTWTPPVRVADLPSLPPRLRGSRPLPSPEEGRILVPDVPVDFATERLLVRAASPAPTSAVDAIWKTVASQDTRLLALRPSVRRAFRGGLAPVWLPGALEGGLWPALASGGRRSVAQVKLTPGRDPISDARVAVVFTGIDPTRAPPVDVYPLDREGAPGPLPLKTRTTWVLPAQPPPGGRGVATVIGLDVPVPADCGGLLVTTAERPDAVLLNAMLVANAPAVRDGRRWTVARHVPETLSLLFEDVVSPEVRTSLLEQPLPPVTAELLRRLPLARFTLGEGEPIADFAGLGVDPAEGTITLNAPDADGGLRPLRPGTRIKLDWYRRTDGQGGEVPAGAISLVEQEPDLKPFLSKVTNPLGTLFGADRESPEAAIDRLSVPVSGLPVLPADFERLARQALGGRASGWIVRCWSYAERTLLSAALWPPAPSRRELGAAIEAETRALAAALETAGPEVLLFVVGPPDGGLSDEELAFARLTLRRQVRLLSERLPVLRDAIVSRLWPLVLETSTDAPPEVLPSFAPGAWTGELKDETGRVAAPPQAEILLNAAVVRVERRP